MLNLKEFLVGEKNLVVDFKEKLGYGPGLARIIDTEKGVDYVFQDSYSRTTSFNPFSIKENSILGVYDRKSEVFYFVSDVEKRYTRVDYSDVENYCIEEDVKTAIVELVNNSIISKIGNNKELVHVDLGEENLPNKNSVRSTAIRLFLNGESVDDFAYANFNITDIFRDIDMLVDYIQDKESTVEKLACKFIEEKRESIYRTLFRNEEIYKVLEDLNNDEDYVQLKMMNEVLGNSEFKTVNVLYKKDGKEMKFKLKNKRRLSSLEDSILSNNIVDKKDLLEFQKEFRDKRGLDYIEPEHIEQITHGRKVLYQR